MPPEDRPLVLVVEDEADMARVLEFNLAEQGYGTVLTASAVAAPGLARDHAVGLVLLDLRLPDGYGLDVLHALKTDPVTAEVPVLIVSAVGDEDTVVQALNLGAEDYVTKPFRVRELLARVGRALQRARPADAPPAGALAAGGLELDLGRREARVDGEPAELTRSEFDIVAFLVRHPGRVFTRHQLCHQALGAGDAVQERTIDAHVRTIRRKLGRCGSLIMTVWGIGYRFAEDTEAPERA